MKLFNLFKKEEKISAIKVQKLEKNQLSSVIGGGDPIDPTIAVTPIRGKNVKLGK